MITKEQLFESIQHIDSDMLERSEKGYTARRRKHRGIMVAAFCAIAATICVIFIPRYRNMDGGQNGETQVVLESSQPEDKKEILQLNKLAISASDAKVSSIQIPDSYLDKFGKETAAYKVKAHKYSKKDIEVIAKGLNTDIKKEEQLREEHIKTYRLENGGYIEYYENSGSICYIDTTPDEINKKMLKKKMDKEKCKKIADDFISQTGIIAQSELEYVSTEMDGTIETDDGVYPWTYSVRYSKKCPEGSEGFYGSGLGVKIEIDKDYHICNILSVNKEMEKISDNYATISEKEVIDKICQGDGVQVQGEIKGDTDVFVNRVNLYLYCDPVPYSQTYMAPYYVLAGKNKEGEEVTITVPAVENSMAEYM